MPGDPDPIDQDLEHRLKAHVEPPRADFRVALGRWVDQHDPGYGPRPAQLGRLVVAALTAAALLLFLAWLLSL